CRARAAPLQDGEGKYDTKIQQIFKRIWYNSSMIKVIHDTDIGSDIDDAVALAYLLANPECELLGVTTVTGNVEQRAQLASVLCKVAGRDVPIYPGSGDAILVPQKQPDVPQAEALVRWDHDQHFPKGAA